MPRHLGPVRQGCARRYAAPVLAAVLVGSLIGGSLQLFRDRVPVADRVCAARRTSGGSSELSVAVLGTALTAAATAAAGRIRSAGIVSSLRTSVQGVSCTGPATPAAVLAARRLQQGIAAAVRSSPARIAAAVQDWTTGVRCSYRGTAQFDSASIIKATTLAALLWQAQRAGRGLTAAEQEWAEEAITESDNDAQTALWNDVGGARGVQRFLAAAGMTTTTAAGAGLWGLTQVSAQDQVTLLRALARGGVLTAASRRYQLGLMRDVTPSQRWGVPDGAPAGTTVAVKNGWLPDATGWHINSIGYVTGTGHEYAMAVLSDGSDSMQDGVEAVQAVARAIHSALG